jgi:hypothetical protein
MIFDIYAPKINREYQLQEGVIRLSTHNEEEETFDVVKKRKIMDGSSPPTTDDDTSPTALAAFEDFERSVLPALEQIKTSDDDDRRQELLDIEDCVSPRACALNQQVNCGRSFALT